MISFDSKKNTFRLDTPNSTYSIFINERGYIGHTYYGSKIGEDDVSYLTRNMEYGFSGNKIFREKGMFLDFFPQELPTEGLGDYRESALAVCDSEGHNAIELKYKSHKISAGAKELPGLPAVFGGAEDCSVLELTATDDILGAEVTLIYTVFEKIDAIVRSVRIKNNGTKPFYIKKALSLALDIDNDNFDMITLHGSWARERHMERHAVHMGKQGVVSMRGETSHQEHPFIAILDHNADWDSGRVYGINFIYSGNFVADVQRNQFDNIRAVMGINPEGFTWKLENGEVFDTPQAVLVYSDSGLNAMSRTFHDLYREHLIRSPYKKSARPVLINNWEATYFNFDTEKLIDIAREASKDGIEMLVMDDGWFGHRSFDDSSLGDWYVNEDKIKGGLKHLVDEVNKLGMKFGIWFEPEMISPDSDLYRAHPDWAIQIPDREPGMSRQQLVLDITRKEVEDHTYESVAKILRSANIEYVKWDMNRQLTDIGSIKLPADRIGEFYHRYVLAVYRLQERLLTEFPKLLLENCSGGGARFDPGMFFYSPQIWCSDDTDAIERLAIQEGTALIYPLSTMGAHVSVCPNHACGRVTPFKTRGYVALSGTFGYELDITKLPPEERAMIPSQVALYKRFGDLVRNGDYSRIASYRENNEYDCWASIAKDKSKALITFVQVMNHPNYKTRFIKINGLKPESKYRVTWPDEKQEDFPAMELYGRTIAKAGIPIRRDWGDFRAQLIFIEEI